MTGNTDQHDFVVGLLVGLGVTFMLVVFVTAYNGTLPLLLHLAGLV